MVWVTLPSESKEAYAKLTAGLTPRPARTLQGVGEDALPVARVNEVVEGPSAATPAPASDGSKVWIVALGGGVLAALMAGLLLRIRHRRASTPPAAPEHPEQRDEPATSGRRRGRVLDEQEQRGRQRRHGDAAFALRQTRHSPDSCESESAADSRRAVTSLRS